MEENRERLRQRKKRRTISCFPCRDRKVKCDKSQPCNTCIQRSHPDLCTYEKGVGGPSTGYESLGSHISPSFGVTSPTSPACVQLPANDYSQHSESRTIDNSIGMTILKATSSSIVQAPFLGEHAIPSFARAQADSNGISIGGGDNVEGGLLPILGIWDTGTPVEASSTDGLGKFYEGLPSDREIIK